MGSYYVKLARYCNNRIEALEGIVIKPPEGSMQCLIHSLLPLLMKTYSECS